MLTLAAQRLQHGSADSQNQEPPTNLLPNFSGVSLNDIGYFVERETGFEPVDVSIYARYFNHLILAFSVCTLFAPSIVITVACR
jgi:hypothetical protein